MTAEKVTTSEGQNTFQMEGEDITQKKDGGVLKLVKREGKGTELPMTGDKVYVHYVGTLLDGTKFDSSRDRGEKFSFELGKGQVIKAWDLGVASMKAGEISQLICKPEYGYGEAGSPPKIPSQATLVFEVELFEFHGEDITEDEDRGVVRRIITRGGGYAKPSEGSAVQVNLEGSICGTVFDQRELNFEIGDGERLGLPVGVEKAIMSMEEGENSLFTIMPKYGFGNMGKAEFQVPPAATLQYRIKLTAFERAKESWEMNTTQKLEESGIAKGKGTQYFKEGRYRLAVGQYKRIVTWLARESGLQDEDGRKVQALQLAAHLNLAICYLRMQELGLALESCNKALELDESNEKALFRRGEACFAMKDFERAREDFHRVLRLYPTNRAARTQVALCQRHIKEQQEKDRRIYSNMFQKFAERDSKKSSYEDSRTDQNGSMDVGEYGSEDQKAA